MTVKKIIALLLAISCCFSLAVTVSAEEAPALAWGYWKNTYLNSMYGTDSANSSAGYSSFSVPRSADYSAVSNYPAYSSTKSSITGGMASAFSFGFSDAVSSPVSVYLVVSARIASTADNVNVEYCSSSLLTVQTYDTNGDWSSSNASITDVSTYDAVYQTAAWYSHLIRIDIEPGDVPITAFRVGRSSGNALWSYYISNDDGTAIDSYQGFIACPTISLSPQSEYSEQMGGILSALLSIDGKLESYLPQFISALNNIVSELQAVGADTALIVEYLGDLAEHIYEGQYEALLGILEYCKNTSQTVDAIYYMLTEGMRDSAESLSMAADNAWRAVDNERESSSFYQAQMEYNFDSVGLDEFSFDNYSSGVEFVGATMSSIWEAFGSASIIFSFPLVLGLALLVVGRIPKGQRKSDRGEGS